MALYEHENGERSRAVDESAEDERLRASDAWTAVDESEGDEPEPEQAPARGRRTQSAAARGVVSAASGDGSTEQ